MRSDVVNIDNQGNGFGQAIEVTKKLAEFNGLKEPESIHLQLFTEEMLSMARSITGELKATFWIENEGNRYELNMNTATVMDKEKRDLLISASKDRKNDAAKTFLGMLRDSFEEAMLADDEKANFYSLPDDIASDVSGRYIEELEWDRYESSILCKLADDVKIGVMGGNVNMKVIKTF